MIFEHKIEVSSDDGYVLGVIVEGVTFIVPTAETEFTLDELKAVVYKMESLQPMLVEAVSVVADKVTVSQAPGDYYAPTKSSSLPHNARVNREGRWFVNGDFPDNGVRSCEGKIVRRFNRPDIHQGAVCIHCNNIMNNHGWIDSGGEGIAVCPGDVVYETVDGQYYTN